jgi:DNA-binding protein HU-beta
MNKGELIENVASELKISKAEASRTVDAVLESITRGLKSDTKVNIVGFGTFTKRDRGERRGVNPITKVPMTIPATTTCGFRPSSQLKQHL